ncbi:MAG: hypothetical protein P4N41_24975 [Negativicutes bacterium]|nr:hypothetical protein [Negativicutes bacterium]
MSVFKTYIGDLDDPEFTWNPDEYTYDRGNAPRAVSPRFPVLRGVESAGFRLVCKIAAGEFRGKQVDWGCWVAVASKAQIIDFINSCYLWAECGWRDGPPGPAFEQEYDELLSYVNRLESGREYGLVARESADIPLSHRSAARRGRKSQESEESFQGRRLA